MKENPMRQVMMTVAALLMMISPMVVFAAQETAEASTEAVIGISNLILIIGIGAIVVVGLVMGVMRGGGKDA
jgi:uncharacterized integral membrane protein